MIVCFCNCSLLLLFFSNIAYHSYSFWSLIVLGDRSPWFCFYWLSVTMNSFLKCLMISDCEFDFNWLEFCDHKVRIEAFFLESLHLAFEFSQWGSSRFPFPTLLLAWGWVYQLITALWQPPTLPVCLSCTSSSSIHLKKKFEEDSWNFFPCLFCRLAVSQNSFFFPIFSCSEAEKSRASVSTSQKSLYKSMGIHHCIFTMAKKRLFQENFFLV